jgi:hypothetical protein
MASCFKYKYVG